MKKAWVILGLLGIAQSAHAVDFEFPQDAQAAPQDFELTCPHTIVGLNQAGDLYVSAQHYLAAIRAMNYHKQNPAEIGCETTDGRGTALCLTRKYFDNHSTIHAARLEVQRTEREFYKNLNRVDLPYSWFDSAESLAAGIGPFGPFLKVLENRDYSCSGSRYLGGP